MPRRKRREPTAWHGPLAEPIKWEGPASLEPEPTRDPLASFLGVIPAVAEDADEHARQWLAAYQKVIDNRVEKLPALADHYKIALSDPNWCILLLSAVCSDFIPGFQIDRQPPVGGRPKKWDDARSSELMADVEAIKRELSFGDSGACRILAQRIRDKPDYRERYASSTGTLEKQARSLNTRLTEARKAKVNGFLDLAGMGVHSYRVDILIALFALDPEQVRKAEAAIHPRLEQAGI